MLQPVNLQEVVQAFLKCKDTVVNGRSRGLIGCEVLPCLKCRNFEADLASSEGGSCGLGGMRSGRHAKLPRD